MKEGRRDHSAGWDFPRRGGKKSDPKMLFFDRFFLREPKE